MGAHAMKDKRKKDTVELEKIRMKINELDQQFSKLILNQGAYFMALLDILKEEGLLKGDRFQKLADHYKKELRGICEYADFLKMMRAFGKKKP
jgi:hypothetical protein